MEKLNSLAVLELIDIITTMHIDDINSNVSPEIALIQLNSMEDFTTCSPQTRCNNCFCRCNKEHLITLYNKGNKIIESFTYNEELQCLSAFNRIYRYPSTLIKSTYSESFLNISFKKWKEAVELYLKIQIDNRDNN